MSSPRHVATLSIIVILIVVEFHNTCSLSVHNNSNNKITSDSIIAKLKTGGQSRIYSSGLIFYDLKTNKTILPPIVTSENYSFLRAPQIGLPCSCQSMVCGCCAGMNFQQFKNQFCTNVTYDPDEFEITMDLIMNNNSIYRNSFSARNPPQFCVPIPIPYIPIRVEMCLKVFNVFTIGRNLHMCLDFLARVEKAPVIVLHFDCMRMGLDGVTLLKPEDGGGVIDMGGGSGGGGGIFGGLFGGGVGSNSSSVTNNNNNVDGATSPTIPTQVVTEMPSPEEQNPDIFNDITEIKND